MAGANVTNRGAVPRDPVTALSRLGCNWRLDYRGWIVLETYTYDRQGAYCSRSLVGEGTGLAAALADARMRGNVCSDCGALTKPGAVVCGEARYCEECASRHVEACPKGGV